MIFSIDGNNCWLFQKAYYFDFIWNHKDKEPYAPAFFKDRLTRLKNTRHIPIQPVNTDDPEAFHSINLITVYPGLSTGVGVTHESKSKGELKLGFEFDYSEGMPVIRGHSVKGAIRAAFPQHDRKNVKYKKEKAYQLHCWIENIDMSIEGFDVFQQDNSSYERIVDIEQEIFEGRKDGKQLSNYQQDVFFDTFITKSSTHENTLNQYLGSDSITPHGDNPLKNPIPIPFLKVLPGVVFEFRFLLHNNGLLSEILKKKLFKKILLENGIGAKTNVGYGQFIEEIVPVRSNTQASVASIPAETDEIPAELYKFLKKNQVFRDGTIESISEAIVVCTFTIDKHTMKIVKKRDKIEGDLQVGQKVVLTVNSDYDHTANQKLNCKIKGIV